MSYAKKSEFVDKYLTLCEKYKYFIGSSSAYGEVRIYEILRTGGVFVKEDEMWEGHKEEVLEDLG